MKMTLGQLRSIIKEEIGNLFRSKKKKAAKKKPVPRVTSVWKNPASGASYLHTSLGGFYFTPYDMMLTPVAPQDVPKNLESWTKVHDPVVIDAMLDAGEFIEPVVDEEETGDGAEVFLDGQLDVSAGSSDYES